MMRLKMFDTKIECGSTCVSTCTHACLATHPALLSEHIAMCYVSSTFLCLEQSVRDPDTITTKDYKQTRLERLP